MILAHLITKIRMKNVFLKNIYVARYTFDIDGEFIDFSRIYVFLVASNTSESFLSVTTCNITINNFFFNDSKTFFIKLQNVKKFELNNSSFSNFTIKMPLIYCEAASYFPIIITNSIFSEITVIGLQNGSVNLKKI